jgi:RHS repeat-associated protein
MLIPEARSSPRPMPVATPSASTATAQKPAPAKAGGEDGLSVSGRFGYTGQMRLPELGLYHYKARVYPPAKPAPAKAGGRFLQPDPIGTNGGLNLYEYTLSDPINATDPWGLVECWQTSSTNLRCTAPATTTMFPDGSQAILGNFTNIPLLPPKPKFPNSLDMWADSSALRMDQSNLAGYATYFDYEFGGGREMMLRQQAMQGDGSYVTQGPVLKQKPKYSSSIIFRIGQGIDTLGGYVQEGGTGLVVAGGAVGLASWFTGVGAGAGGTIVAGGVSVYAGGTAVSAIGNFVKFLGGQSGAVTARNLLSLPTVRIPGVGQIIANKTLEHFGQKAVPDPCE